MDGYVGWDAGDDRGVGVIDGNGLRAAAVVATKVGGGVGANDYELVGAGARYGLVTMGDDRNPATGVGGNDRTVIGSWHRAGAFDGYIGRDAGDDRGRVIIDGNCLGETVAVAAGVSSRIGALDDEVVSATSGSDLVAVGDDQRAGAVVGGDHRAVVGSRHRAGALKSYIGGDAGDRGRDRVIDQHIGCAGAGTIVAGHIEEQSERLTAGAARGDRDRLGVGCSGNDTVAGDRPRIIVHSRRPGKLGAGFRADLWRSGDRASRKG